MRVLAESFVFSFPVPREEETEKMRMIARSVEGAVAGTGSVAKGVVNVESRRTVFVRFCTTCWIAF